MGHLEAVRGGERAPQRGVIAFISNRKFLTGWPYAGLRQMMRQRFDRIEIFDLRGDVRTGERADVEGDQGVFNIKVGTAITLAIADGSKAEAELADVFYSDSWAENLFSRYDKFERLRERSAAGTLPNPVPVRRGSLDDMRPESFQTGEWIGLREAYVSWARNAAGVGRGEYWTVCDAIWHGCRPGGLVPLIAA